MRTCGTVNAIKTLSDAADHLHKHTAVQLHRQCVPRAPGYLYNYQHTLIAFCNYFTIFMIIIMFILFIFIILLMPHLMVRFRGEPS